AVRLVRRFCKTVVIKLSAFPQKFRDRFHAAVFQKRVHKAPARVLLVGLRQKKAGFYKHQLSRVVYELACHLHVKRPHGSDMSHVLIGYLGDGYVKYIYLVLVYKRKQKVKRPFVLLYFKIYLLHVGTAVRRKAAESPGTATVCRLRRH